MSSGSPCAHVKSNSDGEEQDRPERMRDWLIRMINSDRFPGLVWLDQDKTVFKVPWIHAKKRGYDRKRDAALFKEWAIHSGKYRDESDPTVWKINFRCAINGLKDIVELKDYQTEDCRVYKVLPRTRPLKRRRSSRRNSTDPYPTYQVTGGQQKKKKKKKKERTFFFCCCFFLILARSSFKNVSFFLSNSSSI